MGCIRAYSGVEMSGMAWLLNYDLQLCKNYVEWVNVDRERERMCPLITFVYVCVCKRINA